MVRVVVGDQDTGENHAVRLDGVNQIVGGVRGINDDAFSSHLRIDFRQFVGDVETGLCRILMRLAFFGRWLLYICVKFQAAGLRRARAM